MPLSQSCRKITEVFPTLRKLDGLRRSYRNVAVADSSTSAIDRVFDMIDSVVDKTDRVLNRTKYTEEQHRSRRAKRPVIDTAPTVKTTASAPSSSSPTSTALATKRFRIVETASDNGTMIFVVTNGKVRAECTTRELAEKILRGLEGAP